MSNTANLNIGETAIVFLGVQFAGYATSRSIDELKIDPSYRLLILWAITIILLIPVAFIKTKRDKIAEKKLHQLVTKIATELENRKKQLRKVQIQKEEERINLLGT